jgi:hypothetical protein
MLLGKFGEEVQHPFIVHVRIYGLPDTEKHGEVELWVAEGKEGR